MPYMYSILYVLLGNWDLILFFAFEGNCMFINLPSCTTQSLLNPCRLLLYHENWSEIIEEKMLSPGMILQWWFNAWQQWVTVCVLLCCYSIVCYILSFFNVYESFCACIEAIADLFFLHCQYIWHFL